MGSEMNFEDKNELKDSRRAEMKKKRPVESEVSTYEESFQQSQIIKAAEEDEDYGDEDQANELFQTSRETVTSTGS